MINEKFYKDINQNCGYHGGRPQIVSRGRTGPEQSSFFIMLLCSLRQLHLPLFLLVFPLGLSKQWIQEDKDKLSSLCQKRGNIRRIRQSTLDSLTTNGQSSYLHHSATHNNITEKYLNIFCSKMKNIKIDLGETKLSQGTVTEKKKEESERCTTEDGKYRKAKVWHQRDHS